MVNIAQRIEQLRGERGMSRPALAAALEFPKTAIEKFETGRQTPTQVQQEKLAAYFGVSLYYLRGESNDREKLENWIDGQFAQEETAGHVPMPPVKRAASAPAASAQSQSGQGTMLDAFLASGKFQESLRAAVLDVLRTPEGQDLIRRAVHQELVGKK